ncbi:MAG TPA: hypothetical protein VFY45_05930 [Baekduia sp.]|nr:hypothetical protein [Baekduia sp.]
MVDDPRTTTTDLRKSEHKWLRDIEGRLAFDESAALDRRLVRRASQAYRLLLTAD